MKRIKIKFVDFWTDDLSRIFLYDILKEHFEVELSEDPDFLFFSNFGTEHLRYKCVKIQFFTENVPVDRKIADYSIGFEYSEEDPKHLRYPLYLFYEDIHKLVRRQPVLSVEELRNKKRSVSFIVSNPKATARLDFFRLLENRVPVSSAGRVCNNMAQGWVVPMGKKLPFLEKHVFNLAFENSASPGYTTEKIFQPFLVNSIPIYWGDPLVDRYFNPDAFIWVKDLNDASKAVDRIAELLNNEEQLCKVLNAPPLPGNVVPQELRLETLLSFLESIFYKNRTRPVSRTADFKIRKLELLAGTAKSKFKHKLNNVWKG